MPTPYPLLISFVRMYNQNNQLRIRHDGADSTITIPVGEYPLGLVASVDTWAPATTLFQAIRTQVGGAADNHWNFFLETEAQSSLNIPRAGGPINSGHVWAVSTHTDDRIYFDDAATTMSPWWFGRRPGSGTYTLGAGGLVATDASDASSVLALVLPRRRRDRPIRLHQSRSVRAGRIQQRSSVGTIGSRFLELRGQGRPRDTLDNSYHSLRRWWLHLRYSMGCGQAIYLPDGAEHTSVVAWEEDGDTQSKRDGFRVLVLDSDSPDWRPRREFGQDFANWALGFRMADG